MEKNQLGDMIKNFLNNPNVYSAYEMAYPYLPKAQQPRWFGYLDMFDNKARNFSNLYEQQY